MAFYWMYTGFGHPRISIIRPWVLTVFPSPRGSDNTMAEKEVIWGTSGLETSDTFTGKVVRTRWEIGKAEFGSKNTWVWEIEPTSYQGTMRPVFYRSSVKRRSVWGRLQESLERLKLITPGMNGDPQVDGKEFEFKRETMYWGKNKETGEDIESDVTLPVKVVQKGAAGKSTPPSTSSQPTSGGGDTEQWVMDKVSSEATPLESLYTAGKAQNYSKAQVLKAVQTLQKAGKVVEDEGVIVLV